MRLLYHFWLSAPCRLVRLLLHEKRLDYKPVIEKVWERRADFLALNPAGEVPVLVEPDGTTLTHPMVITEFLEEVHTERSLLGDDPLSRAECRRLIAWFETKFAREVTDNLVGEKVMKRFLRIGQPNSESIRAGLANIHYHLDYIAYLSETRNWLGGDEFSLADIAAGAHLSVVDYLGDVPWDDHGEARAWYQRLKSRPSFRPLLDDLIPGLPPPRHYADLDF